MTKGTKIWVAVLAAVYALEYCLSTLARFKEVVCESVDGVLLSLVEVMETDDEATWEVARELTGDRSQMMRSIRVQHLDMDPSLRKVELVNILLITNSVEEIFFLLSKVEREFNVALGDDEFDRARLCEGRASIETDNRVV